MTYQRYPIYLARIQVCFSGLNWRIQAFSLRPLERAERPIRGGWAHTHGSGPDPIAIVEVRVPSCPDPFDDGHSVFIDGFDQPLVARELMERATRGDVRFTLYHPALADASEQETDRS